MKQYKDVLPAQPHWHLLVTSREEITNFHKQPIGFLNEEQSIELFKKYYTHKKLNEDDLKELVKAIDYHTLTIEILAKTAEVQRYDAATLKQAIEKDLKANVEVNRQSAEVEKVGAYLSTVFNMSKLEENEVWLMKQFACLPPEFHTYELAYELTTNEGSSYKETFAETIRDITKKGWLLYNTETDSYKMHRIIVGVVKKQHTINIDDVESLIGNITDKLSMDYAKDNPVDKFVWIPFGKALLDNLAEDGSNEITVLQNNLAAVLKDLGNYEAAKSLLEKALASDEKNFEKDHPRTAIRHSNLGNVLYYLGDYEGAKSLFERAMASNEKNFGKDHPSTARSYSHMALVLRDLGDFEGAKSLLEKAVASDERNFGKEHPSTARRYSHLALVLKDLGNYEAAKSLLEKAVASDEKNLEKIILLQQ